MYTYIYIYIYLRLYIITLRSKSSCHARIWNDYAASKIDGCLGRSLSCNIKRCMRSRFSASSCLGLVLVLSWFCRVFVLFLVLSCPDLVFSCLVAVFSCLLIVFLLCLVLPCFVVLSLSWSLIWSDLIRDCRVLEGVRTLGPLGHLICAWCVTYSLVFVSAVFILALVSAYPNCLCLAHLITASNLCPKHWSLSCRRRSVVLPNEQVLRAVGRGKLKTRQNKTRHNIIIIS